MKNRKIKRTVSCLVLIISLLLPAFPVPVYADAISTKGTAAISRIARSGTAPSFSDSAYMGGTGLTQKLPAVLTDLDFAYSLSVPQATTNANVNTDHHRDNTSMAHNSSAVIDTTFTKETSADYAANTNTTRAFKITAKKGWYNDPTNLPSTARAYLLANERPDDSQQSDTWWNVLDNLAYLNGTDGGNANTALHAKLTELGYTGYYGSKEGLDLGDANNTVTQKLFFVAEQPGVYEITFAVVDAVEGILAENAVEVSVLPRESRYKSRGNPLFPMWMYIPDTVPFVAEDPDNPGKQRLYWSGSHDVKLNNSSYCGTDQVMWSAPVEDLTDWTYHGVTFEYWYNNASTPARQSSKDLYAPDMTVIKDADGKPSYYWFPFPNGGPNFVAKSDRPDGPFTNKIINWNTAGTGADGIIGTDPGVFWDPEENRAWQYQGIGTSTSSPLTLDELDVDNIYNRKAGTSRVNLPHTVDNDESESDPGGRVRYYEAPKLSKIWFDKTTGESLAYEAHNPANPNHIAKYVLVYARRATTAENKNWAANQKAYAWADSPEGPFTFGGILVDAGGEALENGTTASHHHNTHGAMFQVGDKWYISYHKNTGRSTSARQSVVEELYSVTLDINNSKLPVVIPEVEITSMGFNTQGLKPYEYYSAGFACYYTPESWTMPGSHLQWDNTILPDRSGSASQKDDDMSVVNIMNGNAVGFKYFNFSNNVKPNHYSAVEVNFTPNGYDGYIDVFIEDEKTPFRPNIDSPTREIVGTIEFTSTMEKVPTKLTVPVPKIDSVDGKKAVFFVFRSNQSEEEIANAPKEISDINLSTARLASFHGFEFKEVPIPDPAAAPVGIDIALDSFDRFSLMADEEVTLTVNAISANGTITNVTNDATTTINITGNGTYNAATGKLIAGPVGKGIITVTYGGFTEIRPFNVYGFNPRVGMITVNGQAIENFNKDKFRYSFASFSSVPTVVATLPSSRLEVTVTPPTEVPGTAVVVVKETANPSNLATYYVYFRDSPVHDYFADGTKSDAWKVVNEDVVGTAPTWRVEKGKGLILPTKTVGRFGTNAASGTQTTTETSTVDVKNMFTLPAAGDWRIVAKIHLPATTGGNNQYEVGVYAWEDENNFVVNRALVQGSTGGSVNLRKGTAVNGKFKPNKNGASLTLTNRVLYLGLEKGDNYYTALHSTNGRDFPGTDGRFGPYTTTGSNEPQFAAGSVQRDVHFGIMASKDNETRTDQEFIVEYVMITSANGTRTIYNADMRQYGVDNALNYVADELAPHAATPIDANITIPTVPNGYTSTVTSSNPSVLSNTGTLMLVPPADGETVTPAPVTLNVAIMDGSGATAITANRDIRILVNMTDTQLIENAKVAIEGAIYDAQKQAVCNTAAQANAYVQDVINGLQLGTGLNATVVDSNFVAAIAGDETNPSGTDGSYTFTVSLSKNGTTGATAEKSLTITATPLTHADAPNITGHPTDQTVNTGDEATLSVVASVSKGTLSYQWYENSSKTNEGGSAIDGATSANYNAPTGTVGTKYYYCIVTNTDNTVTGSKTVTATSNAVSVVVNALTNAETPDITGHPTDQTVNTGDEVTLSVVAGVSKGTLSYQWYENSSKTNGGGSAIDGAISANYNAPTGTVGTKYYYCVVTNTDNTVTGNKIAIAVSNAISVMVHKANQATLKVNPVTGKKFGDAPVILSTSGGSGTGAVTYTVVSGSGRINGNKLTITGAGKIVVKATKAADDNYNAVSSVNCTIIIARKKLAKPTKLKLTKTKATWKKVANNNGYILKVMQGKKTIFKVQVKKNKTGYKFTKKQLKKLKKGKKYAFTLLAKGTGNYTNSKIAKSKALKINK